MNTKQLFETQADIKSLRVEIDCLHTAELMEELDKVSLNINSFDNELRDTLFRYKVLQIFPNALYYLDAKIDVRPLNDLPFTTHGYNIHDLYVGGMI